MANTKESMNLVFANQNKEESIYSLITSETAEAQQQYNNRNTQLVKKIKVLCEDGKIVITKSLQHQVEAWFYHYLQHPGTRYFQETLCLLM